MTYIKIIKPIDTLQQNQIFLIDINFEMFQTESQCNEFKKASAVGAGNGSWNHFETFVYSSVKNKFQNNVLKQNEHYIIVDGFKSL